MAEEGGNVAAAVYHMQDEHEVIVCDAVDDDVIAGGEAAQSGT